jgi:hypothetical protein
MFAYIQLWDHNECLITREFLQGICIHNSYINIDLTKYTNIEEVEYFEKSDKVAFILFLSCA